MAGPLSRSPLTPEFWGGIRDGLRSQVAAPMAQDVMQGHNTLRTEHPLAYQTAQMHPAVGIPAAALSYADAMQRNDTSGAIGAALSGVPVVERTFRVGGNVARGVQQALTSHLPGRARNAITDAVMGGVHKVAAGQNVAEMGEAGYDQFAPRPTQRGNFR